MVSVTVLVVSVVEVIFPWVKLGTTGTAVAVLTFARTVAPTIRTRIFFISHYSTNYRIVNDVTTCPIALLPEPPALKSLIPPTLSMVPANSEV